MFAEVTAECGAARGTAGVPVRAVIAFRVGSDPASIACAGERFGPAGEQMPSLVARIVANHLNVIIKAMTAAEVASRWPEVSARALRSSRAGLTSVGLVADSLQIEAGPLPPGGREE
jgi:flotillin